MIAINFEEAEKVKERFNVLGNEAEGVVSLSKSIDPSGVSSFSPSTVASDDEIKSTVNNIKNYISTYHSNYATCIDMYKKVYDAIGVGLGRISEIMNYEQLNLSSEYTILGPTEDGKMLRVIYKGKECLIANTRINCFDYQKYVYNNGYYQDDSKRTKDGGPGGLCQNDCNILCGYYFMDMLRGTFTKRSVMANGQDGPLTKIHTKKIDCRNTFTEEQVQQAQEQTYEYIYNEVSEGRPVIVQVSQKDEGKRHYVVITGFDASVKSAKDLNSDTLIALDCWDGQLDFLSGLGEQEGGRSIYTDGVYRVSYATEKFKSDQVYNEKWLNDRSQDWVTINNRDMLDENFRRPNSEA